MNVQIPVLSGTSTKLLGLYRPGIQIFKLYDLPGFQGPMCKPCETCVHILSAEQLDIFRP